MNNIEKYWEKIANSDPHWGVLVSEKYLSKNINEDTLKGFYNSGNGELNYMINYLKNKSVDFGHFKKFNFLEIGTGTGRIAKNTIKYCNNLYCIDVSDKYLELCSEVLPSNHTLVNYKNFYKYKFEKVKLIYTWITLQHNPPNEIKKIVHRVCDILAKDGYAFLHIPYGKKSNNYKYVDAEIMQMNLVPKNEIAKIINENNCSILDIVESDHCGAEFKNCYYIFKKNS